MQGPLPDNDGHRHGDGGRTGRETVCTVTGRPQAPSQAPAAAAWLAKATPRARARVISFTERGT